MKNATECTNEFPSSPVVSLKHKLTNKPTINDMNINNLFLLIMLTYFNDSLIIVTKTSMGNFFV